MLCTFNYIPCREWPREVFMWVHKLTNFENDIYIATSTFTKTDDYQNDLNMHKIYFPTYRHIAFNEK